MEKTNVNSTAEENMTTTSNGMTTLKTSSKRCADLFFHIGAMRNISEDEIVAEFYAAFNENPLYAMKILFWSRDIRGGAGERRTTRSILKYLANKETKTLEKNLHHIPEFGRWDDLLVLIDTPLENNVLTLIKTALIDGKNGLCAKWMPREKSKKFPGVAKKIRKTLGVTPKEYRNILSSLSATANVVEQKMCANSWDDIEYSHVASVAMNKYRKAFYKHDEEGIKNYIESLKKGETKINSGAIFPHDIVRPFFTGRWGHVSGNMNQEEVELLQAQWDALPNYLEDNNERIIPICDVSGSMHGLPMEVCVALGMYIAERNEGAYKNAFITFSETPSVEYLPEGNLQDRVSSLSSASWGMSTNLGSVFNLLLDTAEKQNISQEEMPTTLLIFSDMQFDRCVNGATNSAFKMIEERFKKAGYDMPKVVFWNLNAHLGRVPVKHNEQGVALVSGFSPSIMTSILSGANFTPEGIMLETINKERYSEVTV